MADRIHLNPKDSVVLFSSDEYGALLSLLHELQEPSKLDLIAEEHKLALTHQQIKRISGLWAALTNRTHS
jgi:hypothetical protein